MEATSLPTKNQKKLLVTSEPCSGLMVPVTTYSSPRSLWYCRDVLGRVSRLYRPQSCIPRMSVVVYRGLLELRRAIDG